MGSQEQTAVNTAAPAERLVEAEMPAAKSGAELRSADAGPVSAAVLPREQRMGRRFEQITAEIKADESKAYLALENINEFGKDAVPYLFKMAADKQLPESVRLQCLGKISANFDEKMIPAAVALITDPKTPVELSTAMAGIIGNAHGGYYETGGIDKLCELIKDKNTSAPVKGAIIDALSAMEFLPHDAAKLFLTEAQNSSLPFEKRQHYAYVAGTLVRHQVLEPGDVRPVIVAVEKEAAEREAAGTKTPLAGVSKAERLICLAAVGMEEGSPDKIKQILSDGLKKNSPELVYAALAVYADLPSAPTAAEVETLKNLGRGGSSRDLQIGAMTVLLIKNPADGAAALKEFLENSSVSAVDKYSHLQILRYARTNMNDNVIEAVKTTLNGLRPDAAGPAVPGGPELFYGELTALKAELNSGAPAAPMKPDEALALIGKTGAMSSARSVLCSEEQRQKLLDVCRGADVETKKLVVKNLQSVLREIRRADLNEEAGAGKSESTREVRARSARALLVTLKEIDPAAIGGYPARMLAQQGAGADPDLIALAAASRHPGALAPLLKLAGNSENPGIIRLEAIRGLGTLGDQKAVPLLLDNLNSLKEGVRFESAAALMRLGNKQGAEEFANFLGSRQRGEAAVSYLLQSHTPQGTSMVYDILASGEPKEAHQLLNRQLARPEAAKAFAADIEALAADKNASGAKPEEAAALKNYAESIKSCVNELGINHIARYTPDQLNNITEARQSGPGERPVVIILAPKRDLTEAFHADIGRELAQFREKGYQVMVYEPSRDKAEPKDGRSIEECVIDATTDRKTGKEIKAAGIAQAGHGSRYTLAIDCEDPRTQFVADRSKAFDQGDAEMIAAVSKRIIRGGFWIFNSCSTGYLPNSADGSKNVVEFTAEAAPHLNVSGPRAPITGAQLEFTPDGKFTQITYNAPTYTIPARQ